MSVFKLKSRVQIKNTSGELDGMTGSISGTFTKDHYMNWWIVSLDLETSDGSSSVVMPETCLMVIPTYKGVQINKLDIESDWFDEWQKKIYDPTIPSGYDYFKPYYPNQAVAKCTRCGRDVYAVESYSCPNSACPLQPRATL